MIERLIGSLRRLYSVRDTGAAVVEFAITAPFMVVLVLGVADYGALMNASASLEGATRAVAEYVRDAPQCALTGLTSSNCLTGINGLVSTLQSNNSSLSSATFTVPSVGNVPLSTKNVLTTPANYCSCTDGTAASCSTGTCNVSGDTRVLQYIKVTATQSISPLVSYGTYTSAQPLNANTTTRIQ
jgi:Flp pilus assembly protein TadG